MSQFSFATSAIPAFTGISLAVIGITAEKWKPAASGLVLILARPYLLGYLSGRANVARTEQIKGVAAMPNARSVSD